MLLFILQSEWIELVQSVVSSYAKSKVNKSTFKLKQMVHNSALHVPI